MQDPRQPATLELLNVAADSAIVALALADMTGTLVYVNDAFAQFVGLAGRNEIIGKPYSWLADHLGATDQANEIVEAIQATGQWRGEIETQRPDGTQGFVQISSSLVTSGGGEPIGMLTSLLDVTDVVRARIELDHSRERAGALLDAIPDLMFRLSAQGEFLDYRAKQQDDLYVPPDAIVGKRLDEIMPPHVTELTRAHIEAALRTRQVQAFEYDLAMGGEQRYFEARLAPSSVDEVVAIVRDVTDRTCALAALRESEDKYRGVVENVGIGIALISPAMEILSLNRQMQQWFPTIDPTAKPTCYRAFNEPPRDEICSYCPTHKTLSDGARHEAITNTPAGDEVRHFRIVSTPIKDANGKVTAAIEMVEDISERLELMAQLEEKATALERSNTELREATTQLVHSEKLSALGELSAGVAHELNQPLNGIKIICQSLLRDPRAARSQEGKLERALADVVLQVDKMAAIITHMRLFSRHSDGAHRDHFDLNTVAAAPLKLFGRQLADQDIAVALDLHDEPLWLDGDPIRLEQVLVNLISNARSALDRVSDRPRHLRVRTLSLSAAASPLQTASVAVEVEDNGPGIPPEVVDKIFQPFFTTRSPGDGTGLGLSISHRIVQEHGGRIEVRSAEGRGATFRLLLPASPAEPD